MSMSVSVVLVRSQPSGFTMSICSVKRFKMCIRDRLNGFFKRLETYPEMKTERFTAVKRSVFV